MKKNKCKYCSVPEIEVGENEDPFAAKKDNNLSILFDAEDKEIVVDNTVTGEASYVNINYCPFCRRAL